jgi:hypothetical protein
MHRDLMQVPASEQALAGTRLALGMLVVKMAQPVNLWRWVNGKTAKSFNIGLMAVPMADIIWTDAPGLDACTGKWAGTSRHSNSVGQASKASCENGPAGKPLAMGEWENG